MTFDEFKTAVVSAARARGLEDWELYYEGSESTEVEAFEHEINGFTSAVEGGVSLRVAREGRMGYASTQELSAYEALSLVRRAAENAACLESEEAALFTPGGQVYEDRPAPDYPLPDAKELTKTVLALQEKLLASDPLVLGNSQSAASAGRETVAIFNSRGLDVSFTAGIASLTVAAIVGRDGEMSNDYEFKRGDIREMDTDGLVQKAVDRAKAKLGGEVPPTGNVPVVFAPEAMASLLAAYSPIFSSERAQKGLSALRDKEGQTVAAGLLTLVDDPFYPENPMPVPFDAEGTPAHRKNIIDRGVLTTLLYNLQTAARAGRATTGNAARNGVASKVGIRPFTLYVAPGEISREALLRQVGEGVYINMLGGLHAGANVISGDFSLQSAGFLIEGGELTRPVRSFTVAGNFFDLLKNVKAVASDLESRNGRFASPSVLVEGLSIAGR